MSVSITLDKGSMDHLEKQFKLLQEAGPRSVYSSLAKIAYKIKAEAQLRLRGKNHIVTSRLRNSLFVKTADVANIPYSDKNGKGYVSELPSVSLEKMELAIGTNVEYAQKMNNININRGTTEIFVNGLRLSGERSSEITEYYQTDTGVKALIKSKLLGYFKIDGFISLPELKEFLYENTILNIKLIEKGTEKIKHEGKGIVKNIKITYPDDDISIVTVKFIIG